LQTTNSENVELWRQLLIISKNDYDKSKVFQPDRKSLNKESKKKQSGNKIVF